MALTDDKQWLTALRAIDKLDRLGEYGVRLLLGPGRWDGGEEGKGDFTKGAGLSDKQAANVMALFESHSLGDNDDETLASIRGPADAPAIRQAGVDELDEISKLIRKAGYDWNRIRIDPSVVRGLEYYTGPVYEVELLLETNDEKGRPVRFGSVGGGGRYDGLVSRFRGEPVPATGFSIGVSRLQAALTLIGKLDSKPAPGPVVVTVFDRSASPTTSAWSRRCAPPASAPNSISAIRRTWARSSNTPTGAARPCVVIQGGDEKARGEVQIKDLIAGAKAAAAIASNREWREERPAQFAVKEEKLVDAVREVLARHGRAG